MITKRLLRLISSEKSQIKLDPSQYIPRTQPKVIVTETDSENMQEMKKLFGQDFKTPYEKYDLIVPRVDNPEGPKSSYDRYHEKTGYKESKKLIRHVSFFVFCILVIFYATHRKSKILDQKNLQQKLEISKNKKLKEELFSKIYEERKKKSDEIKKRLLEENTGLNKPPE